MALPLADVRVLDLTRLLGLDPDASAALHEAGAVAGPPRGRRGSFLG